MKALWIGFGAAVATLGTSTSHASGLHSQVSMVTYTDFGQNMGRYRVNGVNDLLSSIRKKEGGVVITYKEGHDDYTLEHYMPSFESQGDNGAYAAVGYNFIATVAHNGCQNPIFTGRYIGDANSLRYYGVEYNDALDFCMVAQSPDKSATFDYKVAFSDGSDLRIATGDGTLPPQSVTWNTDGSAIGWGTFRTGAFPETVIGEHH